MPQKLLHRLAELQYHVGQIAKLVRLQIEEQDIDLKEFDNVVESWNINAVDLRELLSLAQRITKHEEE